MMKILTERRQIGCQRVLNGPELGRVGQVAARTRAACDADQAKHGHEGDDVSLYGSLTSGASAHAVILYSRSSIVPAYVKVSQELDLRCGAVTKAALSMSLLTLVGCSHSASVA